MRYPAEPEPGGYWQACGSAPSHDVAIRWAHSWMRHYGHSYRAVVIPVTDAQQRYNDTHAADYQYRDQYQVQVLVGAD